jgi:hypothetical protein
MPTRAQRRRGRRAWSQARNVLGREAAASLAGRSRRPTLLRRLQQRRRPRGRLRDHLRRLPSLPGPRRRVGTTRAGNGSRGWSRAQKPAEGSMRERGLGTTSTWRSPSSKPPSARGGHSVSTRALTGLHNPHASHIQLGSNKRQPSVRAEWMGAPGIEPEKVPRDRISPELLVAREAGAG